MDVELTQNKRLIMLPFPPLLSPSLPFDSKSNNQKLQHNHYHYIKEGKRSSNNPPLLQFNDNTSQLYPSKRRSKQAFTSHNITLTQNMSVSFDRAHTHTRRNDCIQRRNWTSPSSLNR